MHSTGPDHNASHRGRHSRRHVLKLAKSDVDPQCEVDPLFAMGWHANQKNSMLFINSSLPSSSSTSWLEWHMYHPGDCRSVNEKHCVSLRLFTAKCCILKLYKGDELTAERRWASGRALTAVVSALTSRSSSNVRKLQRCQVCTEAYNRLST